MCEVCEANIIVEAILWLCLIVASIMTFLIPMFISVYFLIGFIIFLIETKFEITHFFFGPYFPFKVGIFLAVYPLILFANVYNYYIGEDIVASCPECGHENWNCLQKKGKIYGKCEKCGIEFVK